MLPQITPEARRYAVKELARRAGVSREFYQKWTVEVAAQETVVSFGPGLSGQVRFIHSNQALDKIACGDIPVARAAWLAGHGSPVPESDLIVPFCGDGTNSHLPLYQFAGRGVLACRLDILASLLFTLSRVEETLCQSRDEHGRFPASASLAVGHGFFERAILDEHGLAFQQALSSIVPGWQPASRELKVKLTHDIDDIGIPFQIRASLGHSLKRRRPSVTVHDMVSLFTDALPTELSQVNTLANISDQRGLSSAFYWKSSPRGPRDSGYEPMDRKVQRVIADLKQRGFELGVHPGYKTFGDRSKLAGEVAKLCRALHVNSPGGRQHYLRWTPETWLDWEACGLSYDSTLGFAEQFGFRAGTGLPYRPWSFRDNRELRLVEIPLILMDCTPVMYMKLRRAEALERIRALLRRMENTGGVFTILWHNSPLLDPAYDGWYESILDLVAGVKNYGVPESGEEQLW